MNRFINAMLSNQWVRNTAEFDSKGEELLTAESRCKTKFGSKARRKGDASPLRKRSILPSQLRTRTRNVRSSKSPLRRKECSYIPPQSIGTRTRISSPPTVRLLPEPRDSYLPDPSSFRRESSGMDQPDVPGSCDNKIIRCSYSQENLQSYISKNRLIENKKKLIKHKKELIFRKKESIDHRKRGLNIRKEKIEDRIKMQQKKKRGIVDVPLTKLEERTSSSTVSTAAMSIESSSSSSSSIFSTAINHGVNNIGCIFPASESAVRSLADIKSMACSSTAKENDYNDMTIDSFCSNSSLKNTTKMIENDNNFDYSLSKIIYRDLVNNPPHRVLSNVSNNSTAITVVTSNSERQ